MFTSLYLTLEMQMKKIAVLMAVIATLAGNAAYAQQSMTTGKGAAAATSRRANESLAWGIGLGALAVLGAVVGLTAAAAENSKSTSPFNH